MVEKMQQIIRTVVNIQKKKGGGEEDVKKAISF